MNITFNCFKLYITTTFFFVCFCYFNYKGTLVKGLDNKLF